MRKACQSDYTLVQFYKYFTILFLCIEQRHTFKQVSIARGTESAVLTVFVEENLLRHHPFHIVQDSRGRLRWNLRQHCIHNPPHEGIADMRDFV